MKTPGQTNYEGFMGPLAVMLLEWDKLNAVDKMCWERGAQAAIDAQPCQHPWECVIYTGATPPHKAHKCTKCGDEL